MDNNEKEAIIHQFPPELRKLYDEAERQVSTGNFTLPSETKLPHFAPINAGSYVLYSKHPPAEAAPLVQKAIPNTVVGRPVTPQEQPHHHSFIVSVESPSISGDLPQENGRLIIAGWEAYYSLVKDNLEMKAQPEVDGFVKLVESIPKACGCVRGALSQSARGMYSQMLPVLHARTPELFENLKLMNNVSTLSFKEGDLLLLEV